MRMTPLQAFRFHIDIDVATPCAAFGLPQRRRRVIIVASLYLNVRDVLLAQGVCQCMGVCRLLFSPAEPCYRCFQTNCDAATVAVQVGCRHTPPVEHK